MRKNFYYISQTYEPACSPPPPFHIGPCQQSKGAMGEGLSLPVAFGKAMRERPLLALLLFYLGAVAGMPAKPKGSDIWQTLSLDTVQVNTFPNQTVNLSLSEFKNLAEQNRVLHNSVLPLAKVNSTLFPHNLLLFGNNNLSSVPGDDNSISGYSLLGEVNWPTFIKGGYISLFYTYGIHTVPIVHKTLNQLLSLLRSFGRS